MATAANMPPTVATGNNEISYIKPDTRAAESIQQNNHSVFQQT